jgi:type II secretory pathway pseudopilin PulG
MHNTNKVLLTALILLTSTAAFSQTAEQSRKDGLRACLAEAQTEYRREYFSHCPGGHNYPCTLPYVLSSEIQTGLWHAQNECYSANSAGLFTPDPTDMRPKTDAADDVPPAEAEPRGKFWISPQ